jgi:hypothetical protein
MRNFQGLAGARLSLVFLRWVIGKSDRNASRHIRYFWKILKNQSESRSRREKILDFRHCSMARRILYRLAASGV